MVWTVDLNQESNLKLNADRPHPRDCPSLIRHTDKLLGPVMVTVCFKLDGNYRLLHSASQIPNIDGCTPGIWPWPLTSTSDLTGPFTSTLTSNKVNGNTQWCPNTIFSIWPLTYDLWVKVKVDTHAIKANRPYLHDYPHTASGHRHTCKHLRLVMGVAAQVHPMVVCRE